MSDEIATEQVGAPEPEAPAPPEVDDPPAQTSDERLTLTGRAGPAARVRVEWTGGEATSHSDRDGAFTVYVPLREGPNVFDVITEVGGRRSPGVVRQVTRLIQAPVVASLPSSVRTKTVVLDGATLPDTEVWIEVNGQPRIAHVGVHPWRSGIHA